MTSYSDAYRNIDFRKDPEKYRVGRGEQGVLIAEPYKSELLPLWKFATPELARQSAKAIYEKFQNYKQVNDFVGMDMARKYLQMGFTRARRYANHANGHKYDADNHIRLQDAASEQSVKAQSATIFKTYYDKARQDENYLKAKAGHKKRESV